MAKTKSKKNLIPETLPESDKFIFAPHPRLQVNLQGHKKVAEKICQLFNQNKAPHGIIFLGSQGIGKATFVYHLIRALERKGNNLSTEDIYNPDQEDSTYRRLKMLSHGNIQILRRQYNQKTGKFFQNIRMEEIRNLRPFFELKSHSDGKRYIIIDSLDDCVHGQNSVPNAILKTLEEPPQNCYFFIIAHKEGMILPTIKSRCMTIHMSLPTSDELGKILENIPNFSAQNSSKAIEMANGSVRMAIIYGDPFWLSYVTKVKQALFKAIPATQIIPMQALKDRSFDGNLTYSEYMHVLQLLTLRAVQDNAKFSVKKGLHAAAYASGVLFSNLQDLFAKAEEYNFTAFEVLERIIAHLDYYHYIRQEITKPNMLKSA